ncbi:MAG: MmpS family transport accessory protein [Planctomycetia bacterium]|nr:MmpS family transport accessory protein [Planctomycetia bacterium]
MIEWILLIVLAIVCAVGGFLIYRNETRVKFAHTEQVYEQARQKGDTEDLKPIRVKFEMEKKPPQIEPPRR